MSKKKYLSLGVLYTIIICFTCVMSLVVMLYINKIKQDKEKALLSHNITTLEISYHMIIAKYKLLIQSIFSYGIDQNNILKQIYQVSYSSNEIYKNELDKTLSPLYKKLSASDIQQISFILKNNQNFIGLYKQKIPGFKYLFPLKYNNEFIGNIQINLALNATLNTLSKIHTFSKIDANTQYSILMNKEQIYNLVSEKQKLLYKESTINSSYFQEDINAMGKTLFSRIKNQQSTAPRYNAPTPNENEATIWDFYLT